MGDAMVVLVTGASTGIGRAAAVELARRGAQVFGTMRDLARVGGLSEAAAASGVTVEAVELDVRSAMSVRACVDHVVAATGRLDVLVNNAAAFVYAPLEFTTDDELAAVVDTNLVGPLRTIRAVLPVMRRQGGGRIVNVGSVASEPKFGLPLSSVYGATKAALHAISLDLNKELAALGIDVVLCEGGIGGRTAMLGPLHDGVAAFGHGDGAYAKVEAQARHVAGLLDQFVPEPDRAGEIIADACLVERPDLRHPLSEQAEIDRAHTVSDDEYRRACRGEPAPALTSGDAFPAMMWRALAE